MIAIVDYGMGNLRSVQKACEYAGYEAVVTSQKQVIRDAGHIILPGVGAVRDAVESLKRRELWETVIEQANSGKPFLGICLGMQMLFERSLENGTHECLGLIEGRVSAFQDCGLRIPHIGWNTLVSKENPLFKADEEQTVYFVHSYHAEGVPEKYVIARSDYGYPFVAAVCRDNIFGTQFHPEKSGETGIRMIRNFGGLKF